MVELKPCPFCGADVEIFDTGLSTNYQYMIKHPRWQKNGCIFDDGKAVWAISPEAAAEVWNMRATNKPIKHGQWVECDYKTLEHGEIESTYKAGICCSECRTGFKKNHMAYKAFCPACGAKMDKDE